LFALLQLNDPDPLQWTLIYGASALVAVTAARARPTGLAPWLLALVAAAWAARLAWRIPWPVGDLFALEDGRELAGLVLVVAVMVSVGAAGRWSPHTRAAPVQEIPDPALG
jgi:hypothetical protein